MKRFTAVFLAMIMLVTLPGVSAFAEHEDTDTIKIEKIDGLSSFEEGGADEEEFVPADEKEDEEQNIYHGKRKKKLELKEYGDMD